MMGELRCLNPKGGYFILFITKHLDVNVVRSLLYRFGSNEDLTLILKKIAAAYDLTNRANVVKSDHSFSFDIDGGVKASVMQSGTCQVKVPVPQYQILMLSKALDDEDRKAINKQMNQKYRTPDFK